MNSIHALVVDDNVVNLKVLVQMLSKQGVRCTEVVNPTKVESILLQLDSVDVAFIDLEMPGLDGYQVKELLRSYFPEVPIIAYTVHISEINMVRESGFNGFLGKPLDNARFPDQLKRILRHEPVWERA